VQRRFIVPGTVGSRGSCSREMYVVKVILTREFSTFVPLKSENNGFIIIGKADG